MGSSLLAVGSSVLVVGGLSLLTVGLSLLIVWGSSHPTRIKHDGVFGFWAVSFKVDGDGTRGVGVLPF